MSLAIICCHYNPGNFQAPRRNLLRFLWQMESADIPVFIAELAYDQKPFLLPSSPQVFHFRTSASNILWHKENLLNLAACRVPSKYDKLAWIDPDIFFMSRDWIDRAELSLESFAVLQLFREALWSGPDGRCYKRRLGAVAYGKLVIGQSHPGFAWAARRELWTVAGGLSDRAILGAGDALFACTCLGCDLPDYIAYPEWKEWNARIAAWVSKGHGCGSIPGTLIHEWHGTDAGRAYKARHSILKNVEIDCLTTSREDGLLEFRTETDQELRRRIKEYFVQRDEDVGTDVSVQPILGTG